MTEFFKTFLKENFGDLAIQNRLNKTIGIADVFSEEQVRRFSPKRANFYNEYVLSSRDPDARKAREYAYNIAAARENRDRLRKERLDRVKNALEYINATSSENEFLKQKAKVLIDKTKGGAPFLPVQDPIVRKIEEKKLDLQKAEGYQAIQSNLATLAGEMRYNSDIAVDNIKGTNIDVVLFIMFTYFLQVVALNIVEWMMTSGIVSHMSQAVLGYLVTYILLFLLVVVTVAYSPASVSNLMFLFSSRVPGGPTRILIHLAPYAFMFVLWSVLKMKTLDKRYRIMTLGDRKKMIRKLNKVTFTLWGITSIAAFATK